MGRIMIMDIAVIRCPRAVIVTRSRKPPLTADNEAMLPPYAYPKLTPQNIADCPWKTLHPFFFPLLEIDHTARTIVIDMRTPSSINMEV